MSNGVREEQLKDSVKKTDKKVTEWRMRSTVNEIVALKRKREYRTEVAG